jgi:O-antigen/teichoic acid export membrane protein
VIAGENGVQPATGTMSPPQSALQSDRAARWLRPHRMRQLWYAPLLGVAMALMMARTLLMARMLGVRSFADFSGATLISSSFCMLGCLGLQLTLQREWPANIWRGQELRGLIRAAQCNLVTGACALALIGAVLCGISIHAFSPPLLVVGILHGCAQQIFVIATVESRSRGDALRFSLENLLRALAIISVGFGIALKTGSAIDVVVVESLLTLAISVGLLRRSATHTHLNALQLYQLALRRLPRAPWRAAMTLLAITGVAFLLSNIDRWIAAAGLGIGEFAAYSFAWTVPMLAQSAQQILNTLVFPTMARRFASGQEGAAFRVCSISSLVVLIGGVLCSLPAFFVLRYSVEAWYPKYATAIAIIPIFVAVAVLRVSDFWTSFLIAVNRERLLVFANVGAGIAGLVLWSFWIHPGTATALRAPDVAVLALILSAINYMVTMGCAWKARRDQLALAA